jgi:hypothetical protein
MKWFTSVIPDIQEAQSLGGLWFETSLGKKLVRSHLNQ